MANRNHGDALGRLVDSRTRRSTAFPTSARIMVEGNPTRVGYIGREPVEEDGDEVFIPIDEARCPHHGLRLVRRGGFWRCPVLECVGSYGPVEDPQ